MKKLMALVKSNLLIQKNVFCDVEPKKFKKKIISVIMIGLFILCSMEIYVSKAIDLTSSVGVENKYIFYSLISMEIGIVSFISFYRILNSFYLTSSVKDIFIYPVKDGVILLSKFILVCYQNIAISVGVSVPLVTYGILTGVNIEYYLELIIYQLLIVIIPPIYIILISLTILWISTVIKKSKVKSKINNLILILDVFVGVLTSLSIIYREMLILSLTAVAILSVIGFYFIGGSVYLTIMKSEVLIPPNNKVVAENADGYKFKKMSEFKSNIIRDLKILKREPALKGNCLMSNFILNLIFLILLLEFGLEGFGLVGNAIFFEICVWPLSIANATAATSFSREGSGLRILRMFPIDIDKYIFSKFCVACLSYLPTFVLGNVMIFNMSKDIIEFMMLELVVVSTITLMVVINMKMDSENISLRWIDIKELFELERILKLTKPVNIAYVILVPYFLIHAFCFKAEMNNYYEVIILIFINIILSTCNFKKVKVNFKLRV